MSFPVFGLFPLGSRRLAPLPYDAEVEYVESVTDRQCIDTGILGTDVRSFSMDVEFTQDASGDQPFFGVHGASDASGTANRRIIGIVTVSSGVITGGYFDRGRVSGSRINLDSIATGTRVILPLSASRLDDSGTVSGVNLFVFCNRLTTNNAQRRGVVGMRVRSLVLNGANGTPLRNYKPVRVGTAVGYLYDTVSRTLFGNADATGTPLVAGPDKNGG